MKRAGLPEIDQAFERIDGVEDAGHPSVIVPLDGAEGAEATLVVARTLAELIDGMLHVVYAEGLSEDGPSLESTLQVSSSLLRGAVVDAVVDFGVPSILRILDEREGSILVLSRRLSGAGSGDRIRPLAEELIRESRAPLVLVPSDFTAEGWSINRVLMPHDGTPTTAAAFGPSLSITESAGAELIVLHSAEAGVAHPREPGTFGGPQYVDQPQHEWPAWAHEFLERLGCIGCIPPGLRVRLALVTGSPGREIVSYASEHEVDLVVLAWHGHWAPDRARTVRAVIERVSCPVILLRTVE